MSRNAIAGVPCSGEMNVVNSAQTPSGRAGKGAWHLGTGRATDIEQPATKECLDAMKVSSRMTIIASVRNVMGHELFKEIAPRATRVTRKGGR